ncbi:hypothetical protein PtB15_1B345 [Puccinia triticina]|nr:hypothetical protein PtB15_1B345 [Puccinia triticina]
MGSSLIYLCIELFGMIRKVCYVLFRPAWPKNFHRIKSIDLTLVVPPCEKLPRHLNELAPDLKRKVDERRKESAEWDKLYGNTTVEAQYQKAVEREGPKKV